jgi:hypothetical protein
MPNDPAKAEKTVEDEPVRGFPLRFWWREGLLKDLFDQQIQLLKDNIANARAEDRMIVYLSCPISSRGGGYSGTNVEIAEYTERRLQSRWGERVWILNPAAYQMESKSGRGYFRRHAEHLGRTQELKDLPSPGGGDYMRMWTKVLVEDGGENQGRHFDAFFFLGSSDIEAYFDTYGGSTLTAKVESYFSAKYASDADFRNAYSDQGMGSGPAGKVPQGRLDENRGERRTSRERWEGQKKNFLRFYILRASANFSLGCHDEWNIFCEINRRRLETGGDVSGLLAGYFEGGQIDPGASVNWTQAGYGRRIYG